MVSKSQLVTVRLLTLLIVMFMVSKSESELLGNMWVSGEVEKKCEQRKEENPGRILLT